MHTNNYELRYNFTKSFLLDFSSIHIHRIIILYNGVIIYLYVTSSKPDALHLTYIIFIIKIKQSLAHL